MKHEILSTDVVAAAAAAVQRRVIPLALSLGLIFRRGNGNCSNRLYSRSPCGRIWSPGHFRRRCRRRRTAAHPHPRQPPRQGASRRQIGRCRRRWAACCRRRPPPLAAALGCCAHSCAKRHKFYLLIPLGLQQGRPAGQLRRQPRTQRRIKQALVTSSSMLVHIRCYAQCPDARPCSVFFCMLRGRPGRWGEPPGQAVVGCLDARIPCRPRRV